jgi:hypothetical protein
VSTEVLPGQSMTIQSLANDFGVRVMPVREAIKDRELLRTLSLLFEKKKKGGQTWRF